MDFIKKNLKVIIFVLIIVVIIFLDQIFGWSKWLSNQENLAFLKQMVNDNLLETFVIFCVLTIVGCVILALPGVIFAILAGMVFGPVLGIIATDISCTIGAMGAFIIGRYFLQDSLKPTLMKNKTMQRLLFSDSEKNYLVLLMITRMLPLIPYNLQNFAYGITDCSFKTYSICTFIFIIPGVSFYTIGAAGLTAGDNAWMYFLIAAILCGLVLLASWLIKKKFLDKNDKAIILFTKYPTSGFSKTRLIDKFGADNAANLSKALLVDERSEISGYNADLIVCCTFRDAVSQDEAETRFMSLFGKKKMPKHLILQKGDTLGERMNNAFEYAFDAGYKSVVLVGSDLPYLIIDTFKQAFAVLKENDVVFGPATDGGYYLIGMNNPEPNVFDIEKYSTSDVLESTKVKLSEHNKTFGDIEEQMDIDEVSDLKKLSDAENIKRLGSETRKFFENNYLLEAGVSRGQQC